MKSLLLFLLTGTFLLVSVVSHSQEQRFMTSDSVNLYLNVKGTGTPCLYIHGGPGSGSYWMEKFAGDTLETRYQMIYLDLRGVGRSGSPQSGDYSMERMLADFEEIRVALGYEQWTIMGHSFSGTLLTGYASKYPESLTAMLMFNCSLDLHESITQSWIPKSLELLQPDDMSYFEADSIPLNHKMGRIFSMLAERELGWKLAYSSKEQEARMNATFSEIPDWNADFSAIGLSHPDYLTNFKPITKNIEVPVLFFYGSRDWTVGPEHFTGVEFPNLLLYEADTGHVPFMDDLADVADALDLFKSRYPPGKEVRDGG